MTGTRSREEAAPKQTYKRSDTTQTEAVRTIVRVETNVRTVITQSYTTGTRRNKRPAVPFGTDVRQRSRTVVAIPRRRE